WAGARGTGGPGGEDGARSRPVRRLGRDARGGVPGGRRAALSQSWRWHDARDADRGRARWGRVGGDPGGVEPRRWGRGGGGGGRGARRRGGSRRRAARARRGPPATVPDGGRGPRALRKPVRYRRRRRRVGGGPRRGAGRPRSLRTQPG